MDGAARSADALMTQTLMAIAAAQAVESEIARLQSIKARTEGVMKRALFSLPKDYDPETFADRFNPDDEGFAYWCWYAELCRDLHKAVH